VNALAEARPWAVIDVSDSDRVCGDREGSGRARALPKLAEACAERNVPSAFITGAQSWHPADHPAGVLEVRTQSVFVPWDNSAPAVQMLASLDAGKTVEIHASRPWTGVYGPDMIDVTLDLLFDGVTGAVDLRNPDRLSELEFARELAAVADVPEDLIQVSGGPIERSAFAWPASQSYLPPLQTTLERFAREARCARVGVSMVTADESRAALIEAAEAAE
jgi:hypothetical protein